MFKYFPGDTSNDLLFYIELALGKRQFVTATTHVGINDVFSNTTGIQVLLQNILRITARYRMRGISKIFVSSVLNTRHV